jgi:hypothetical protein
MFAKFYRERVDSTGSFEYCGLVHRAGALFNEADFTGQENAIVDFKYSASPKITWWFDHHLSAFLTPEDHADFLLGQSIPFGQPGSNRERKFYDPTYTSCCSFLAHVAERDFGFDPKPVAELIHWADIVDGALYESAKAAVEMADPAMKLTMAIESTADPKFVPTLIPMLTERPLAEIIASPLVAPLLGPLLEHHQHMIELIGQRSKCERGTIMFDISDEETEGYNKFIPYYLHPEATYNVGLSRSSFRAKVAVGSNPWTTMDPAKMVNLATICERYGGGGHARVGAISFPPDRADDARRAAEEIVAELRAAEQ